MEQLVCSIREQNEMEGDPDILVADEEGWLHEFTLEYMPEEFDGFYTSYPAGIKIVPTKDQDQ